MGNDFQKLLTYVDLLQELVTTKKITPAVGFVRTFNRFNNVVQFCFGNTLHPDEHHTKAFQESYLSFSISVTLKAHAVFHHRTHQGTKSWTWSFLANNKLKLCTQYLLLTG